mgnify:CR=1 FL=1
MNDIVKHSYQLPEAVAIYEESHYISDEVKKQIAEYLYSKMPNKNTVKILDAGIGGGDLVLLPLLDKMISEKKAAKIVGIDNSPQMLKRLKNALQQKGFTEIQTNDEKMKKYKKDNNCNIEVKIYIYDLEEYSFPRDLNEEKFDIILSILTLHHLKNWRLVLLTLIKYLNKDGIFVIFEWTKGIKLRDGNFVREDGTIEDFSDIDPSIVNFWEEFYAQRKQYHAWCPEICASNYVMVKKVLRKLPSIKEESIEFEWDEQESVNWICIKRWIEKGAYSNFYRGLAEEEKKKLVEYVKQQNIPQKEKWKEKLGCRVTIFTCLSYLEDEKITEVVLSSLDNTPIFSKLIWGKSNIKNLLQFSVLLLQHDFITENTLFFTMNKWNMIENTWDKLDKPMIFNRSYDKDGEFLNSMLVYYAFIEKFNLSVTDLIFRDFQYKPILIIRKNENRKWDIKKYINTLGIIEKLEIDIPSINSNINFNVNNINVKFYKPIREDIFHIDFNAQEVKNCINTIKACISDEFFNFYIKEFEDGKNVLKDAFLNKNSPLLLDEKKVEDFVKVLLLHSLIITKWDTAVYIPAVSLLPTKGELISLGGIIIFENNGGREDLNRFLEKRINVLTTVINLEFRSWGIAEYARKVTYEK